MRALRSSSRDCVWMRLAWFCAAISCWIRVSVRPCWAGAGGAGTGGMDPCWGGAWGGQTGGAGMDVMDEASESARKRALRASSLAAIRSSSRTALRSMRVCNSRWRRRLSCSCSVTRVLSALMVATMTSMSRAGRGSWAVAFCGGGVFCRGARGGDGILFRGDGLGMEDVLEPVGLAPTRTKEPWEGRSSLSWWSGLGSEASVSLLLLIWELLDRWTGVS